MSEKTLPEVVWQVAIESLAGELGIERQIDPRCTLPKATGRKCGECYIAPICVEVEGFFQETRFR